MMTLDLIVGGLLAAACFVYLFAALLRPENF